MNTFYSTKNCIAGLNYIKHSRRKKKKHLLMVDASHLYHKVSPLISNSSIRFISVFFISDWTTSPATGVIRGLGCQRDASNENKSFSPLHSSKEGWMRLYIVTRTFLMIGMVDDGLSVFSPCFVSFCSVQISNSHCLGACCNFLYLL